MADAEKFVPEELPGSFQVTVLSLQSVKARWALYVLMLLPLMLVTIIVRVAELTVAPAGMELMSNFTMPSRLLLMSNVVVEP